MKLLSFAKLRQTKAEQPRREPRLELDRGPVSGNHVCDRAQSVPDGLRLAVTDSCPRCGAAPDGGLNGKADCILQSLELDVRLLDEERTAEALREMIGRLEPRLV